MSATTVDERVAELDYDPRPPVVRRYPERRSESLPLADAPATDEEVSRCLTYLRKRWALAWVRPR